MKNWGFLRETTEEAIKAGNDKDTGLNRTGLNEYLKFFPLLKSREKLYVQDQIWKKICEELNYKIIPSL